MSRTSAGSRLFPLLFALGACLTAVPRSPAADAAAENLAASLARADTAWRQIAAGAPPADASARYDTAVADVIDALNSPHRRDWNTGGTLRAGDYLLRLPSPVPEPGAYPAGTYDLLEPIRPAHPNAAVPAGIRPGIGVPVYLLHEGTPERVRREPGLPKRGFYLPGTAVLDFSGPSQAGVQTVRLLVLDPRQVVRRDFGKSRNLPLAADFASPANAEVGTHVFGLLSFLGFFRPQRALEYSGLYTFGPFDPNKVPVVFIHGLNSDPSIWENATVDLMSDPEIGKRCQFWYFFYPTGVPAIASARRLRDSLDQLRAAYDPAGNNPNLDRLILVGHSMGGLLAHLLVIDSGNAFYDAYFRVPMDRLHLPTETRAAVRRNLFFESRRDVDQVVFICTPHRGSRLADWGLVRLLAKLIALPKDLLKVSAQIVTLNVELLNPELQETGLPGFSVIDSLSPRNPYFRAIGKRPIERPFYSIIGDRGRGDSPDSSDGVVGYQSSHWDGARSEQIVPYPHRCTARPLVFEAVHEIVRRGVAGTTKEERARRPRSKAVLP